jgi:hypothetical protein
MAHIAKTERDACNSDGNGKEGSSNGPAQSLRPVEEFLAGCYIPADLQVH